MSTLQQAKPRRANQSITDESGRPGTVRSNVGCEAIDEPWTNRIAGLPSGESTYFSQRKSRTSPSGVRFDVQCSTPVTFTLVIMMRSNEAGAERREQGRLRGVPQRGARQYRGSTASAERGHNNADGPRSSYASNRSWRRSRG